MAQVSDVLAIKGARVFAIGPQATAMEATQLMNRHKIGALVVTRRQSDLGELRECDRVAGMFTERDVLTRLVGERLDPDRTPVEAVMTADVVFARPETDLEDVAVLMREKRIRHLPVCDEEGALLGLISIGDLNAWRARGQEMEINYLYEYIHGRV